MGVTMQTREICTILVLCLLWYIVSSSNNVVGKMLLNDFPYPMTVTMVQLLSITVYSGPFFNMWGIRRFVDISWTYYLKLIIPLAFGKFMASVFTHVSIWKVPVSYAHTVKATMPLFTVVLSRFIIGEKQTVKVYLSLVPIILGVAIATLTELSFDLTGLLSALAATLQHSLQNIFSKKVLADTGIHHLRLLHMLGRLSLMLFLPIWMYFDLHHVYNRSILATEERGHILALLFTDGVLNWLQNILAFSVMSLVTSLTYAVASASKRIFVIAASLLILGNPVTGTNMFGMGLAIMGVLSYNKAKYDARESSKRKTVLPFTNESLWKSGNNSIPYKPLENSNGSVIINNNSKLAQFV
ncbi:hypothetical protein LSTR_LSTR007096 [Laodelphax striatellus]|uniref:Sugar phosphate transporter domain-containing protein n=1 Tax=Laodelphax striatellus TaxID=195883 RepID=A0A482WEW4_LAOST|nr:hypothetical protein LSTR_LSTR007096 [Laodelphax striatellus]